LAKCFGLVDGFFGVLYDVFEAERTELVPLVLCFFMSNYVGIIAAHIVVIYVR
jgi:hypothetical protein